MINKTTCFSLLACLVAAGCASGPYDTAGDRTVIVHPAVATATPIPPVPPAPTLQLRSAGSVVGFPVIDAAGQPVGTVQAVAAERGSGEIRYLVIARPSFGLGYYISVPAANAQVMGNHVILNTPAVTWLQAPRYAGPQISEMYAPM